MANNRTAETLAKAYVGVSEKELRMTSSQESHYWTWRIVKGSSFYGRRPDYTRIAGESDAEYQYRTHNEAHSKDYFLLKCVVRAIKEDFGCNGDDEVFTWIEGVGGSHAVVSNYGSVFHVMYYSSSVWKEPEIPSKSYVRGVFRLRPDKRMSVTICNNKGLGYKRVHRDGSVTYQQTMYVHNLLREYFTAAQLKAHFSDAQVAFITAARRESRYKRYMVIEDVQTGEVMKFRTKEELAGHFGMSKSALSMALKRGTEDRVVRLKRREYRVIVDSVADGKNKNTGVAHSVANGIKKRAEREKARKEAEKKARREEKKFMTWINREIYKQGKKFIAYFDHQREMRNKAIKMLGVSRPYEELVSELTVEKVTYDIIKPLVSERYLGDKLYGTHTLGIQGWEWMHNLIVLLNEELDHVRFEREEAERKKKLRYYYAKQAWERKRKHPAVYVEELVG